MYGKTERRQKWLTYKKEDPFGMKARFIRADVFKDFRSYACSHLNACGWMFAEGSYDHKLWKLYHCDLEEIERLYSYKMRIYEEKHSKDMSPTLELREIFMSYLTKAYDLYKQSLYLHSPKSSQCEFFLSWFEKNIKKYSLKD